MFEFFTSETRLYTLSWPNDDGPALAVEAWWGDEALSAGFEYHIDLLSADAFLELKHLLGRPATLNTRLSDGTDAPRSGYVRSARKLGSDGGLARYRITLVPWLWLLSRGAHHRVFQNQTVIQIVEAVFADYADVAAWSWSDEVTPFLAATRPRSYCVQYNESDYQFVSRLLAEEGIGWRSEVDTAAPGRHRVVLFTDSRSLPEDRLSASTVGGQGIRFHRADSQEEQDTVVAFGEQRRLFSALATALSWDYKAKRAVTASVPTLFPLGGEHAPRLESYDDVGLYAFATAAEGEHYGRLGMEAREAHAQTWLGYGTVRSLTAGSRLILSGLPLDPTKPPPEQGYAVTAVSHIGINNLVADRIAVVAERLTALPDDASADTDEAAAHNAPLRASDRLCPEILKRARERGYANRFSALPAARPWRPRLTDDQGERLNPRPTAPGPMSAVVVGPEGNTAAAGKDELWCDALGRVKIRFHWQQAERPDDRDSCWVRVMSRQAAAGMGWQWLPRIGQEVLVGFLNGDIDRPYIMGGLYNGRGEGGVAATPGGAAGESDPAVFDAASDHRPTGQGNLAGGYSPAWHGAAPVGHRHAAALAGFKSKEFGGAGYNQLLTDDTDQQQRLQLKTTQHASELNLGHLIHQADNYRGSFRGTGIELRTDAWGALRAGQGLVMSTWPIPPDQAAGDMAPAMALLKQAGQLAQTLNQATATHHTVQLAAHLGTQGNKQSKADEQAAPLKALHTIASGMVDAKDQDAAKRDAQQKNTSTSNKVPQLTDPALLQVGKAGIATVAGQNLQFANGEALVLESGEDTNLAIAGKARIHAGQAIGLLAGAIQAGEGNTGIKLIAAKDDIDLQAQSDEMKFLAKKDVKLVSAAQYIDFAAAKKIHLAVEGGASITIDGGITVQCPGTITVHASKKSFEGSARKNAKLPTFPGNVCVPCLLSAAKSGAPFSPKA